MSITDQRAAAVAATIEAARGIVARMGVTRAALDALEPVLIALGERTELFPPEHFRIPAGRANGIFHLAEDADGAFALYGSAGLPGARQLPHDHTTWAVMPASTATSTTCSIAAATTAPSRRAARCSGPARSPCARAAPAR